MYLRCSHPRLVVVLTSRLSAGLKVAAIDPLIQATEFQVCLFGVV